MSEEDTGIDYERVVLQTKGLWRKVSPEEIGDCKDLGSILNIVFEPFNSLANLIIGKSQYSEASSSSSPLYIAPNMVGISREYILDRHSIVINAACRKSSTGIESAVKTCIFSVGDSIDENILDQFVELYDNLLFVPV